jgi:hypothetical protein
MDYGLKSHWLFSFGQNILDLAFGGVFGFPLPPAEKRPKTHYALKTKKKRPTAKMTETERR